ncbi:MAG: hypothetical protein R3C18_22190 [Planctomycetaceae bacterium]
MAGQCLEQIDSRLVVDALEMAVQRELPGTGLVAHSDRGVQYASEHYQQLLARWHHLLDEPESQLLGHAHGIVLRYPEERTRTPRALQNTGTGQAKPVRLHRSLHNRVRRHSALDYQSPLNFEQAA